MENKRIAFVTMKNVASGGSLGGVLVTDGRGFPIEFRYTEPIIPTKIQKVLYGGGIEKYIKVDVILDSLLKVLSSNYDLLIVDDETLLAYKEIKDIVKLSIAKAPSLSSPGQTQKISDSECLLQIALSQEPIRVQLPAGSKCEGERFEIIKQLLTQVGENIDIVEPLDRVRKSVDLVCKREI